MRHVVEESQPLSEPVFLILASLAGEPRHGYGLILDIDKVTGGPRSAQHRNLVRRA